MHQMLPEEVVGSLPGSGPLFPNLRTMGEAHRAMEFCCVCRRGGDFGGDPPRLPVFLGRARQELRVSGAICARGIGNNSQAVHRSHLKKPKFLIPTLEDLVKGVAAPPLR